MRVKIKGWHFQLIVLLGITTIAIVKIYSSYAFNLGGRALSRNEIIGYWVQTDRSLDTLLQGRDPPNDAPCIYLDEDGFYYQDFDYPVKAWVRQRWGTWHFRSEESFLGHKNWLKLGLSDPGLPEHWVNPHFFFKEEGGKLLMYQNNVSKKVLEYEFEKETQIDSSRRERIREDFERG